jgi:hypothetical protein
MFVSLHLFSSLDDIKNTINNQHESYSIDDLITFIKNNNNYSFEFENKKIPPQFSFYGANNFCQKTEKRIRNEFTNFKLVVPTFPYVLEENNYLNNKNCILEIPSEEKKYYLLEYVVSCWGSDSFTKYTIYDNLEEIKQLIINDVNTSQYNCYDNKHLDDETIKQMFEEIKLDENNFQKKEKYSCCLGDEVVTDYSIYLSQIKH